MGEDERIRRRIRMAILREIYWSMVNSESKSVSPVDIFLQVFEEFPMIVDNVTEECGDTQKRIDSLKSCLPVVNTCKHCHQLYGKRIPGTIYCSVECVHNHKRRGSQHDVQ